MAKSSIHTEYRIQNWQLTNENGLGLNEQYRIHTKPTNVLLLLLLLCVILCELFFEVLVFNKFLLTISPKVSVKIIREWNKTEKINLQKPRTKTTM